MPRRTRMLLGTTMDPKGTETLDTEMTSSSELRATDSHRATTGVATKIRAVLVATLEEQLRCASALEVLTALAGGDAWLTTVDTSEVCCALISYRQEACLQPATVSTRSRRSGEYDALTLDGGALWGIVAAAHALKSEALWLDAWCYRPTTVEYDHTDFCRTLHGAVWWVGVECGVGWGGEEVRWGGEWVERRWVGRLGGAVWLGRDVPHSCRGSRLR